jgi:hypothetical protein
MLEPLPDACVVAPGYDGISPPAAGAAEPLSAGAADVAAALSLEVEDVFDDDLLEQADNAIATAIASEMVKKRM